MKRQLTGLSRGYATALHHYLKQGPQASLRPARKLGQQAVALGLETLDVARIHEAALASLAATCRRDGMIKQAELFFAEAIIPIERTHLAALKANARLKQLNKALGRRTVDLAASNRFLKQGIAERKAQEQALERSTGHYARLVNESRRLQKHLRQLTHQILSTQEAERKKISRELHDEIAQTLLAINLRLLTLRAKSVVNAVGLKKEIASTQRLVEKSAQTMGRLTRAFGQHHGT